MSNQENGGNIDVTSNKQRVYGRSKAKSVFTDSLPVVHCNIFHDRKSLKFAWVKTDNLLDADS